MSEKACSSIKNTYNMYSKRQNARPIKLLERIKNQSTPEAVANSGHRFSVAFWAFFVDQLRNKHTRQAYQLAIFRFMDWCSAKRINIHQLESRDLREYLSQHDGSVTTVRQHLSAIRKLLKYLEGKGLLAPMPTVSMDRIPQRRITSSRATPSPVEARKLLDSIDTGNVVGFRDRALIGVLIFSFSRVGMVVNLKVADYIRQGDETFLRFPGKGGHTNMVPVHHVEREYIESYLEKAGIAGDSSGFLFRNSNRSRSRNCLIDQPMTRKSALKMLKRRIKGAELSEEYDCQSFRRTGILEYLQQGGDIKVAARIAGYESTRSIEAFLGRNSGYENIEINRFNI